MISNDKPYYFLELTDKKWEPTIFENKEALAKEPYFFDKNTLRVLNNANSVFDKYPHLLLPGFFEVENDKDISPLTMIDKIYSRFNERLGCIGFVKRLFGRVQRFFRFQSYVLNVDDAYGKIMAKKDEAIKQFNLVVESNKKAFDEYLKKNPIDGISNKEDPRFGIVPGIINEATGMMKFIEIPTRNSGTYGTVREYMEKMCDDEGSLESKKTKDCFFKPIVVILTPEKSNTFRNIHLNLTHTEHLFNPNNASTEILIAELIRNKETDSYYKLPADKGVLEPLAMLVTSKFNEILNQKK
jgi:hypothetical protein